MVRHRESQFGQSNGGISDFTNQTDQSTDAQSESSGSGKRSIRKSRKKKKITTRGSSVSLTQPSMNGISTSAVRPYENGHLEFAENNGEIGTRKLESKRCFISEDFEGVSLLRTTCLECEYVTERKETFCDICVPIDIDRSNEKGAY